MGNTENPRILIAVYIIVFVGKTGSDLSKTFSIKINNIVSLCFMNAMYSNLLPGPVVTAQHCMQANYPVARAPRTNYNAVVLHVVF